MKSLWLMTLVVIHSISLQLVLRNTKKDFPYYIGYQNFKHLSSCTTTELSNLLTSKLTAIGTHLINYYEIHLVDKNAGAVLNKLKSTGFHAASLSTYDFFTLYTALPHNLIKENLID